MQQLHRYLGFLRSELLLQGQLFENISSFEFVEREHHGKSLSLDIPENEVLGKRIEYYFEHYLICSQRYRLLAKNIQVFRNKITIGELDFLIQDLYYKQNIHLELVYKFYLYDPDYDNSNLNCWIGPNRKDRLIEKIEKLQQKQLPLLDTKEAKTLLKEQGIDSEKVHQKVAFFGHLFIPRSFRKTSFSHINPICITGYWIFWKEFIRSIYGLSLFYIPKKKDWIVQPKYNECWKEFGETQKEIARHIEQKKSPLIWMKNNEDSFERFFIVWW